MKRNFYFKIIVLIIIFVSISLTAQAYGNSVSLGLSLGAVLPHGSTDNIPSTDYQMSFNWGMYVNIPLIYTFHLTPSAELYKLEGQNVTDMAIAFKFIVPLYKFDLYAGFVPGLTAVTDITAPHVGVLGGVSFQLISNLDIFIQGKYKFLFEGSHNIRIFHMNVGVLFNF